MGDRTVLSVDIGGTNTRAGFVSEDGSILSVKKFLTPRTSDPYDVTGFILSQIREDGSLEIFSPVAAGVSVAGPVDRQAGVILHPPNMVYEEVPVTIPLRQALGIPVVLMNDSRAGVLGEVWTGSGKGFLHVVYITLSTGIGGGVFSNGRLLTGKGGNAGEIGHMPIDTFYNLVCPCGHIGHWEGIASGGAMPSFFREWCRITGHHPGTWPSSALEILNSARESDPVCSSFISEIARINGKGLSVVIAAYDPDVIIFDGPISQNHADLVVIPACAHIDRYLPLPEIKISTLSGFAPLLGVAAAALGLFE